VGGSRTIRFAQFASLLEVTRQPFHADFEGDLFPTPAARYITLYAFVHRVDGLDAGIYRHSPTTGTLTLLARGDVRVAAAGLSLSQELAGNSCVTFSMIADLARAARDHGNRGYRYAHFEAGAIGQRLYLAAEALGFQSTGIGAFYDDQVHRYLDIEPDVGQVVYHFASGYAVTDPRLSALA
jgi:SagB-type dehydrogenase family enzyme